MKLNDDERSRLHQILVSEGLERHAELFETVSEACYRVFPVGEGESSSIGSSRFGGEPDLPKDFLWPGEEDEEAAIFLAQINLSDVTCEELPREGLLSLWCWGTDAAADPVGVEAHLFDGSIPLERRSAPDPEEMCDEYLTELEPVKVRFERAISLGWDHPRLDGLRNANDDYYEAFDRIKKTFSDTAIGQFLGAAVSWDGTNLYHSLALEVHDKLDCQYAPIFDSMKNYEQAIVEASKNGREWRVVDLKRNKSCVRWLIENHDAIASEASRWQCLLRIDSNEEMNLWINDADPLFCFIRKQDLASRDFRRMTGRVLQS